MAADAPDGSVGQSRLMRMRREDRDDQRATISVAMPSTMPATARPSPSSRVRLIWSRATVPNTMATMEPIQQKTPTNDVISEAIASPLVPGRASGRARSPPAQVVRRRVIAAGSMEEAARIAGGGPPNAAAPRAAMTRRRSIRAVNRRRGNSVGSRLRVVPAAVPRAGAKPAAPDPGHRPAAGLVAVHPRRSRRRDCHGVQP